MGDFCKNIKHKIINLLLKHLCFQSEVTILKIVLFNSYSKVIHLYNFRKKNLQYRLSVLLVRKTCFKTFFKLIILRFKVYFRFIFLNAVLRRRLYNWWIRHNFAFFLFRATEKHFLKFI